MVKQAEEFIRKMEALPAGEQEMVARFLDAHFLEVLDEARWREAFEKSGSVLDQMAAEVDEAIANGRVAALDPDEL
jgi:hypothetical protein